MRINEVITESAELEEGWKSKLAGAALAGAAALGGGHAAHAQNHQPTAQTSQQSASSAKQERENRMAAQTAPYQMYKSFGQMDAYRRAGWLNPEQTKSYLTMMGIFDRQRGTNPNYNESDIKRAWADGEDVAHDNIRRNLPTYSRAGLINAPLRYIQSFEEWLAKPPPTDAEIKAAQDKLSAQIRDAEKQAAASSTPSGRFIVSLPEKDKKFYNSTSDRIKSISDAVRSKIALPRSSSAERMDWKKQLDSSVSALKNHIDQATKNGFNADASKFLNRQLEELKSLGKSIKP